MIKTSKEKISNILYDLNIKEGSYIIIHSRSFMFGKLEGGIGTLYNSLKENLGQNNTLIFPSFTYSYRRNQIFDILKSPCASQIGMLSEIARRDTSSYRNNDPLFSLVARGYDKHIIERKSKSCFGLNSIYDKLFKKNFFILSLGVELTNGISEFMHLEKLAKELLTDTTWLKEGVVNDLLEKSNKEVRAGQILWMFINVEIFKRKYFQKEWRW